MKRRFISYKIYTIDVFTNSKSERNRNYAKPKKGKIMSIFHLEDGYHGGDYLGGDVRAGPGVGTITVPGTGSLGLKTDSFANGHLFFSTYNPIRQIRIDSTLSA
jgi:hypothetical protein